MKLPVKNLTIHLDEFDIDVNRYLTYAQIQNIINYAFRNDNFNSVNCSFIRKNNIKYYNVFFL